MENNVIKEKIRKKENEIATLEEKLKSAKVYLAALNDIMRSLEKVSDEEVVETLRPGSTIALARETILHNGKPLHISELLALFDKGDSKEMRASLTSSIAAYVKRGEVFVRTAPNTFGLIELGHLPEAMQEITPPAGFG
jgi:hypothetical protein